MTKIEDVSKTATVTAFAVIGLGATFMLTMIFLYIMNIKKIQQDMRDVAEAAIQYESHAVVADSIISVQVDSIKKARIEKFITVDSLTSVINNYERTIQDLRRQNRTLKSRLNEK